MLFFIKFLIQKLTNNYFSKILSFLYLLNLRQGVCRADVACEFVNLSVCVGVLNQILSNCRLNLARNLIICSLNLAKFKFSCPNLIILLSLAKALCLKLLVSFKLYAWVRVFKLNFAYELAKFGKENIALIILFTKALTTIWFYVVAKFGKKFASL